MARASLRDDLALEQASLTEDVLGLRGRDDEDPHALVAALGRRLGRGPGAGRRAARRHRHGRPAGAGRAAGGGPHPARAAPAPRGPPPARAPSDAVSGGLARGLENGRGGQRGGLPAGRGRWAAMNNDQDGPTFADLGLRPELLEALDRPRLRGAHADPARGDPAAARRARPARPGRHRHRQDRRLRAAAAPARSRRGERGARPVRAGAGADPRAGRCRCPRRSTATAATSARACCRSTAASRSAGSCAALRARRRRRRRHARPRARPPRAAARCDLDERRAPSCSTRPTRCSTWASPRTSRRSSTRRPEERQTVLFSATMPPRIDAHRPPPPARPGPHPDRPRSDAAAGEAPLVRQTAYVVPRAHKPAALGRVLDVEAPDRGASSSAAPATRSTSSPRRSTAAATGPRRCTAA